MAKIVLLLSLLLFQVFGNDTFDQQCVSCHKKLPLSFESFYMRYLVKYSSQSRIKEAMFYYLRDPKKVQSVMEKPYLDYLGVMEAVNISDVKLKEMIDIYIKMYDVKKRLK